MSKKTKQPQPPKQTKRLRIKKESLRNLTPEDLGIVNGGIGCGWTRTPPPSGCC